MWCWYGLLPEERATRGLSVGGLSAGKEIERSCDCDLWNLETDLRLLFYLPFTSGWVDVSLVWVQCGVYDVDLQQSATIYKYVASSYVYIVLFQIDSAYLPSSPAPGTQPIAVPRPTQNVKMLLHFFPSASRITCIRGSPHRSWFGVSGRAIALEWLYKRYSAEDNLFAVCLLASVISSTSAWSHTWCPHSLSPSLWLGCHPI